MKVLGWQWGLACVLACSFAVKAKSAAPAKAAKRPNILLILVDDESPFDLKVAGGTSNDGATDSRRASFTIELSGSGDCRMAVPGRQMRNLKCTDAFG
jgi:hypothetical protein